MNMEMMHPSFLEWCWHNLRYEHRLQLSQERPRTTWLFGAGVSRHYSLNAYDVCMPLAGDFFQALSRLPTIEGLHSDIGSVGQYLQNKYQLRLDQATNWRLNIEEFMTTIESDLAILRKKLTTRNLTSEERSEATELAMAFNNMHFLFANTINEAQTGPLSPLLMDLLKFAGPEDQFITLNWDTLIDRSLAATGCWEPVAGHGTQFTGVMRDGAWTQPVSFPTIHEDVSLDWRLWKLHGSVNWLVPFHSVNLSDFDYRPLPGDTNCVYLYWSSSFPVPTHRGRWRGGYPDTCYGYYPPNLPSSNLSEAVKTEE